MLLSGISKYNFNQWLENVSDPNLKAQALNMQSDEENLEDSFCQNLQFGVEEIRALEGAGINRINTYTVCQISQAIAQYFLGKLSIPNPKVVITFDARTNSQKFANLCALVLRTAGYNCTITTTAKPTPYLSFLVKELKCDLGISITGGHNEVEYNGFKIFDSNGCPIDYKERYYISQIFGQLNLFEVYKSLNFSNMSFALVDNSLENKFIDYNFSQRVENRGDKLTVVYSDFNGATNDIMSKIFAKLGVQAHFVNNPKLSHSGMPNVLAHDNSVEFGPALLKAVQVNADLILSPSIDSCQINAMVKDGANYTYITGNDLALLLSHYILEKLSESKKLPAHPIILRSVVSNPVVYKLIKDYGGKEIQFAPYFQNICEKISSLGGLSHSVVFGFGENGSFMRGNLLCANAIFSSILICDMLSSLHGKGITPIEQLQSLYKMYGSHTYIKLRLQYPGVGGAKMRKYLMDAIMQYPPERIGGERVLRWVNHNFKQTHSNTMEYVFLNGDKIFVRPSSTEEAVFCYMYLHDASQDKITKISQDIYNLLVELVP